MFTVALKGFVIGFSLICAIGAQNAYVLKQGLLRNHVFWICLTCFLCDCFLIFLGVFGVGKLISQNKTVLILLTLIGAAFLFYYGWLSLRSAMRGNVSLVVRQSNLQSLWRSLATTLGITLLNPHVYLDTVVIIGGVAATLTSLSDKMVFMSGTLMASLLCFFSLGFGAQKLAAYFTRPRMWQILDTIIVLFMWGIAITLVLFAYRHF